MLGITGVARGAGSPASPIELRWSAPSGCPTEAEVGAEIERALGGAPDPASPRHLRAEAIASRAGKEGFRVHLVTDMGGAIGERDFAGPSCLSVARAAALIVALTFDPEAVARRSADGPATPTAAPSPPPPVASTSAPVAPPAPSTPPVASTSAPSTPPPASTSALAAPRNPAAPPSVPAPPRAASIAVDASERTAAPPRFAVSLLTGISLGALPGVGFGIGGRAGVSFGRFGVDLSAAYWPDRSASVPAKAGAGGDVRLVAGDARACYVFPLGRFEIGPCAGIELGRASAVGFGVRHPGSGAALWIAPLVEGTAAFSLHRRFAFRLDIGALVPIERATFVLDGVGSVFRASAVVGRSSLAAEVRF
ncbi:Vegetative cell wall protein gp1 precursor (Hydroxyproline-rich glycoprotein 1) [Minicystis rosea]|nr:Vegetative cell wall protein gp1 precursor (Hydroxyproline-rich glycoprotein 1) [Minicystis rosea]